MNAVTVALAGAALCLAGSGPQLPDRPARTIDTSQRILVGGAIPPSVRIEEVNPYAGDQAAVQQGKALFHAMNCDGCHSTSGEGFQAPSIITGRWRYGGTDAAIFETIFYGRPRGMPAFGGVLPPELTWKLVTFLRSVQPPKAVPTQSWQ
jgi:mono/diheme cytochrome c family protein